jgi:hypothetical protein
MRRVRGEHRQHRRDLAAPDNHDRRAILVIEVQPARQRTRVTARRPPPRVLEHHTMLAQIRQRRPRADSVTSAPRSLSRAARKLLVTPRR